METNKEVILVSCSTVFLLFIYLFEISLFAILLCVICGVLGWKVAESVIRLADGRLLEEKIKSSFSSMFETKNEAAAPVWINISVSKSLNTAVEQFLEQGVENFVSNWYESAVSRDQAFLNEIKYQLRFACCKLVQKVSIEKLRDLIVEEAIPLGSLHLQKIQKASMDLNKQNLPLSLIEAEISKKFGVLHYAMGSRANEINYLRQISEHLVPLLFDDTRLAGRSMDEESPKHERVTLRAQRGWPSLPSRHLLRELLVQSILLPLLDLIADPDTINYFLILLLDTENREAIIGEEAEQTTVPLLHGFTDPALETFPDSLLQLKLSELIRDAKQYSMFRLYLQDTRGPLNELLFVAEADRIHEMMQRKAECSSQISYDIWQLYGQFVHEGAPERIDFEEEIVIEFRESIEINDFQRLERILEKAYQSVYTHLQTTHVVPFCQSDTFLGHLCGSPPISLDLIDLQRFDEDSLHSQRGSITEKSFSLAQFRTRLRKALFFDADDESDGMKDDYNETFTEQANVLCESSGIDDETSQAEDFNQKQDYSMLTPSIHSKSMPDFQTPPSIDVTYSIDDIESSPSPVSVISDIGTDEVQSLDSGMVQSIDGRSHSQSPEEYFIIDSEMRDIGRWMVSIPKVVPAKDPVNGRTIFVYQIQVIRHDAQPHETKAWTVLRRYNEFFVLEAKLNEFHKDSLHIPTLPPRKTFVAKTRAFIDQNRLAFSAFLGNVCKQRQLARSDLLFAFLASNDEFRDALLLSDLNPWKVVKKMPGKLAREKGQNLKPFLLGMLATTLSSTTDRQTTSSEKKKDDASSISSFSVDNPTSHSYYSSIFGDNFSPNRAELEAIDRMDKEVELGKHSTVDSFLLLLHSTLLFSSSILRSILSMIPHFFSTTFDLGAKALTNQILDYAFCDQLMIRLVQLVDQSVFCSQEKPWPTEQEKVLRYELAKRKFVDWIDYSLPLYLRKMIGERGLRGTTLQHLQSLQFPRFNKQLSYVLLDRIVQKLFIQ